MAFYGLKIIMIYINIINEENNVPQFAYHNSHAFIFNIAMLTALRMGKQMELF